MTTIEKLNKQPSHRWLMRWLFAAMLAIAGVGWPGSPNNIGGANAFAPLPIRRTGFARSGPAGCPAIASRHRQQPTALELAKKKSDGYESRKTKYQNNYNKIKYKNRYKNKYRVKYKTRYNLESKNESKLRRIFKNRYLTKARYKAQYKFGYKVRSKVRNKIRDKLGNESGSAGSNNDSVMGENEVVNGYDNGSGRSRFHNNLGRQPHNPDESTIAIATVILGVGSFFFLADTLTTLVQ